MAELDDFLGRESLFGVDLEHFVDELIEGRTVAIGDIFKSLSFQFSDEFFDGIGLKGDFESAEFINNDSE